MNTLDIIMIGIVVFFAIRGFFRGLLREIGSILGLILAFFMANNFYDLAAAKLSGAIKNPDLAAAVAWLGVYVAVALSVLLLITAMKSLFMSKGANLMDQILGGAFALLKGGLVCVILLLVLTTFLPADSSALRESQLAPHLRSAVTTLSGLVPEDMHRKFKEKSSILSDFSPGKLIDKAKEAIK